MESLSKISAATFAIAAGTGLIGLGLAAQAQALPAPMPVYHWCPGQSWDSTWGTGTTPNATTITTAIATAMTTVATSVAISTVRAALTNMAPKDPIHKDPIAHRGPAGPSTPVTTITRVVPVSPGPAPADLRPRALPQSSYTVSRRGRSATPSAR